MCALFAICLDDNNAVDNIEGEKQTLKCITDPFVLLPGCSGKISYISVPVSTVTIIPGGDNNVIYILEGEIWTVACAADSRRAATWIP